MDLFKLKNLHKFFDELYPINRSLTGKGFNKSLNIIRRIIPFKINGVPSGSKVFDWIVPKVWEIKKGYIKSLTGETIIDIKNNNLHVIGYSHSIKKVISKKELFNKLYSLENYVSAIPYVTSYYKRDWGFCISHKQKMKMTDKYYQILIDSSLQNGMLYWGSHFLKKNTKSKSVGNKDTILITSYLCHPSMANNELSGPLIMSLLYKKISLLRYRKYNYLFLLVPETIGPIAYIHKNKDFLKTRISSGFVLTCLGGPKKTIRYMSSRNNNSSLDLLMQNKSKKSKYIKYVNFNPSGGSDERQFCAGELNLPIGQFSKTTYGQYKQYHTSKDDKKFVKLNSFYETANNLERIIIDNENLKVLRRKIPYCELQLGKRKLYPTINSPDRWTSKKSLSPISKSDLEIIRNIISYADGYSTILSLPIVKKQKYSLKSVFKLIKLLENKNLIY